MPHTELLKRLESDAAQGFPYLSCNAGRNDIFLALELVKELSEKLERQTQISEDYLRVLSYQQMQLEGTLPKIPKYNTTYEIDANPVTVDNTKLEGVSKWPTKLFGANWLQHTVK